MSETIEQIAFLARDDKRVDKRSGVSQRMPITVTENVVSNAERRGLSNQEPRAAVRITDLYAALPSITGKMELEYEGELKGGDQVARELVRSAVGRVFTAYYDEVSFKDVVQWFDLGGTVRLDEDLSAAQIIEQLQPIQGLLEKTSSLGLKANEADEMRAAAGEFILEGLCAHRRLSRSEERVFSAGERRRDAEAPEHAKSARKKADLYKQYQ
jgi:magnesium chelatase subunit I